MRRKQDRPFNVNHLIVDFTFPGLIKIVRFKKKMSQGVGGSGVQKRKVPRIN